MKQQTDVSDVHNAKGSHAAEMSRLEEIVGKYKMSEDDIRALIDWRHSAEH